MNNIKFHSNGVIIKRYTNDCEQYLGVEGDNWFLDPSIKDVDKKELNYLYSYYRENDNSWADNYVGCCGNINYINRYLKFCENAKINYVILYCETEMQFPIWNMSNVKDFEEQIIFLGYDYAYPGGSFYSCIFSDVLSKRIPELSSIHLNQYGLFSTEEEIADFIRLRGKLELLMPSGTFEVGDFIIYKLWRYIGEVPLAK